MARRDLTGAVDFHHLETYAGGDPALIDEVLALFREQAQIWIRLLEPASPDDTWRDAAHTLKGAALGIGAGSLAEACAAAEKMASPTLTDKQLRLEPIRNALDRTLIDIAAYVHEQALQSLKRPNV